MNNQAAEIYISTANADMRKGLDGFASIVEQQFKLNAMSTAMFVFHNRHCDKVKILYWDGDGYCQEYVSFSKKSPNEMRIFFLYKRIEYGKFHFPKNFSGDTFTVSREELEWLLHGLHIEEMRHYKGLKSRTVSTENAGFNMA